MPTIYIFLVIVMFFFWYRIGDIWASTGNSSEYEDIQLL